MTPQGLLIAAMQVSCVDKERLWHSLGDTGHLALLEFTGKSPAQAPGPQVCA